VRYRKRCPNICDYPATSLISIQFPTHRTYSDCRQAPQVQESRLLTCPPPPKGTCDDLCVSRKIHEMGFYDIFSAKARR